MACPSPFTFGDPTAAQALARADKVEQELATLKDAIANAVVAPNNGGASLTSTILAALGSWPGSTAAAKIKAE